MYSVMRSENNRMDKPFPGGLDFLELVGECEVKCEHLSLSQLSKLGQKLPLCHERLAELLSHLYREACCFNGCDGGDHTPQRIAARIASHALAAYRMLSRGYYDESMSLTRSIGEAANLLFLFASVPSHYPQWKAADERDRWDRYRPAKVRELLQRAQLPVPIDRERYGLLSSVSVHLSPSVSPQAHAPEARATLGAIHRDEGLMATLNELSGAVGVTASSLATLLPEKCRPTLKEAAVALLRSVGGMDLAAVRSLNSVSATHDPGLR